jgi:cytochrome c556
MRVLSAIGCLCVAGSFLWAEIDEAKLRESMKQIGPVASGLGKKIAAKDPTAEADAKKLNAWFNETHSMWNDKADALAWSKNAGAEFENVAKLTGESKWEEAGASFKKAMSNCSGCHTAYREKAPDGTYKLKK